MTIADLLELCRSRSACGYALKWLEDNFEPGDPAFHAWRSCPYWEWLDWLAHAAHRGSLAYRRVVAYCQAEGLPMGTDNDPATNTAKMPESRPKLSRLYRKHVDWVDLRQALESRLDAIREAAA